MPQGEQAVGSLLERVKIIERQRHRRLRGREGALTLVEKLVRFRLSAPDVGTRGDVLDAAAARRVPTPDRTSRLSGCQACVGEQSGGERETDSANLPLPCHHGRLHIERNPREELQRRDALWCTRPISYFPGFDPSAGDRPLARID